MKRILVLALAVGILLTGCNRAKAEAPPPPTRPTQSTPAATTPTTGTAVKAPDIDGPLDDVDGLLNQVDGQLKADSQNTPDED
jgi:nitrous oxide reductase accessory protein NosL